MFPQLLAQTVIMTNTEDNYYPDWFKDMACVSVRCSFNFVDIKFIDKNLSATVKIQRAAQDGMEMSLPDIMKLQTKT